MEPLSVSHELKQPYSLDVQKLIEEAENEKLKKKADGLYSFYWSLRARGLPVLELRGLKDEQMIAKIENWLNTTDFSQFKSLSLNNSDLTFVPEQISRFTNLTNLMLADNELKDLPSSMESLVHLERLDITGNKFTEGPQVLTRLVALRVIYKDRNIGSSQILGPNTEGSYFMGQKPKYNVTLDFTPSAS